MLNLAGVAAAHVSQPGRGNFVEVANMPRSRSQVPWGRTRSGQ